MITLKNLIPNSNFDILDEIGGRIVCKNWSNLYTSGFNYTAAAVNTDTEHRNIETTAIHNTCLDSKYFYNGNYSILINTKMFEPIISDAFELKKGHEYYFRYYQFDPEANDTNIKNSVVYVDIQKNVTNGKIFFNSNSLERPLKKSATAISGIFTSTTNCEAKVRIKSDSTSGEEYYTRIDSMLLIDLTDSFTELGVPSKEWCDKSLPYFVTEYEIEEKKNVQILNASDFTKDSITDIYYCNDDNIKLIFGIEDFDLALNKERYANEQTRNMTTKIVLLQSYYDEQHHLITDYNGENIKREYICFGDDGFKEENIIGIRNNITIFEVSIPVDSKYSGKQIQIIGDNTLFGDRLTCYTTLVFRNTSNYNLLEYSIEYSKPYISDYIRILKGTTNPWVLSPTTIKVYNNNVQIANIRYTRNNYEPCTFEKELFLTDGDNEIKIEAIDIFGNIIKSYTENINVNILPIPPERFDLLTNFVGNDDQMIELKMDNAKLEYQVSDAGPQRIVDIDKSIPSKFFELEGINSQCYRISRDEIPLIVSDIIEKPIGINFDGVSKIYDGTPSIMYQMSSLKLDNGYKFTDITEQYVSFLNTGFVRGSFENLKNETILCNQGELLQSEYTINADDIDFNGFFIDLDGHEGIATEDGDIIFEDIETEAATITELGKAEYIALLANKGTTGKYYCIHTLTKLDGTEVYTGEAAIGTGKPGSIEFETHGYTAEDKSNRSYEHVKDNLICWLKGFDNKISGANLIVDELGKIILKFHLIENTEYFVKDRIVIKYNYKSKTLNNLSHSYKNSDVGKVKVVFDGAYFDSKNVTNNWQPIGLVNLKLTAGELGDKSNNYQIANYSAYGMILKRPVSVFIDCVDKVYDGTNFVPFNVRFGAQSGNSGLIQGDDLYIDDTYLDDPTNHFHLFKRTGTSYLETLDPDVNSETNSLGQLIPKSVKIINTMRLEGKDANNYYIDKINCNYTMNIYRRKIEVVIDTLRYVIATGKWEVDYHFINVVPGDNVTLSFNKDSEYDFKVYGGASALTEDINISYEIATLKDLSGISDIPSMYFNYAFNTDYKFSQLQTDDVEGEHYIPDGTNHNFWLDKARPAEPATKRMDIAIESKTGYPGDIKLSLTDKPYYESQDKKFRLYNGNIVKITNINLDRDNPLTKNYKLLTTEQMATIEII